MTAKIILLLFIFLYAALFLESVPPWKKSCTLISMRKFSWHYAPDCPCQRLRQQHPDLTTTNIEGVEHIASEARHLSISRRLKFWLSSSARTQIYPDFEEYCCLSWHAVDRWLQHSKIGGVRYWSWREFLLQEWPIHRQSFCSCQHGRTLGSFDLSQINWWFKDVIMQTLIFMFSVRFCIIMFCVSPSAILTSTTSVT